MNWSVAPMVEKMGNPNKKKVKKWNKEKSLREKRRGRNNDKAAFFRSN